MRSVGASHIGKVRTENQDRIFFHDQPVGNLKNLYIVADGMGGHRAGGHASSFAVERFVQLIEESKQTDPIELMKSSIASVNQEMIAATTNKIRKGNIRVVLDQFGSKQSSLASIAIMEFDVLKLDRSIVEDIVGKKILIHGYKHNGKIHRCWSKGLVLQETDDHYIVINNRTLVTESDGRMWHTREPAIWYMPKHKWYNVICMIRKTGVYYYSNIASPTLYDGEALKYIDYDLDLKVFPDGNYRILDQEEYRQHAREMGYSDELDKILKKQLDVLIDLAVKKGGPFDQNFTKKWYSFYQDLKEGYYGKSDYYK